MEGGYNLSITEAPAVLLDSVSGQDLAIIAKFDSVDVPDYQFATFVGIHSTLSIRAGFHGPCQFYLAANDGTGGDFGWSSGPGAYLPGDDIVLTVERTSSLWSLSWNNLTHPLMSGSSQTSGIGTGSLAFDLLNSEPDLVAGIIHAATTPHAGAVDYFQVTVVPEPSPLVLVGMASIALLSVARRRRL